MTLVFAGIQLSITRLPNERRVEEERQWQRLLARMEQTRHEVLRQHMMSAHGPIM